MSTHPSHTHETPTEQHPERGMIGYADVPLFAVEHWIEGGEHVFRSSEFDLIAGDADLGRAVEKFVETADDLWGYLEQQKHLTEGELELVSVLASRFRQVLQELERRERNRRRQRVAITVRPRRAHLGTWQATNQTPGNSSQLSHA